MSLFAVFTFSWRNLIVALVLHWMAVGLGISMGYHRLHTHRGFKTYQWFDYFLAICGTLTLEGGPIFWVATHRLHHQFSDQPEDPHSPRVSGFWAHAGWIIFGEAQHDDTARLARYAPDLSKDRFYRWLSAYHWVPLTTLGLALLAWGGWGMVIWAIFLRVTVGLHATWLINSATHIFGKRRFEIDDDSKNVWWVALLTSAKAAQQPSRAPGLGASRPRVVRVRLDLGIAEAAARGRPGLGHQDGQAQVRVGGSCRLVLC
jgi:stearoyl-CoA desaturase (delta-9 desaturase)